MSRSNSIKFCLLGLAVAFGTGSLLAAHRIGQILANRLGPAITRVGKGKIADPAIFIADRIIEAVWLAALALILAGTWILLKKLLHRKHPNYSWAILGLAAFACINLWVAGAMRTCLFWGSLYTGHATSNLTQYHFKKALLKENSAPRQAILVGSSQTQAQLDENQMNARLGKTIWTTELHFPGSTGLDLLLTTRRLASFPGQDLVCYLSEYYFYTEIAPETAPYFLSAGDLPLLARLGLRPEISDAGAMENSPLKIRTRATEKRAGEILAVKLKRVLATRRCAEGLLGEAVPLFRCRESLIARVLGPSFGFAQQMKYDSNLETNLVKRAEEAKIRFKLGPESDLQKSAFASFVEEAAKQNRRVIILEGQLNPILGERLDPVIRKDMEAFLRRLASKHANVRLLPSQDLPPQSPSDYQDLTHVNEAAQTRFTNWFIDYLASAR